MPELNGLPADERAVQDGVTITNAKSEKVCL